MLEPLSGRYLAPECKRRDGHTPAEQNRHPARDLYAWGLIIAEMVVAKSGLLRPSALPQRLQRRIEGNLQPDDDLPPAWNADPDDDARSGHAWFLQRARNTRKLPRVLVQREDDRPCEGRKQTRPPVRRRRPERRARITDTPPL